MSKQVKFPNAFEDWVRSECGSKCLNYPLTDQEYLRNRLYWAFNAGLEAAPEDVLRMREYYANIHIQQSKEIRELKRQLKRVEGETKKN